MRRSTPIAAAMLAALAARVAVAAACPDVLEAATCWTVDRSEVSVSASASAGGDRARCTLRCEAPGGEVLILRDDGTYSAPAGTAGSATFDCPSGAAIVPPEENGVVRRRRGKLLLVPADPATIDAFADACSGQDVRIRRHSTAIRIAPDGATLSGVTKLRLVTGTRPLVSTRVTARFTAVRATAVGAARARARKPLPPCAPDLEPRCRASY